MDKRLSLVFALCALCCFSLGLSGCSGKTPGTSDSVSAKGEAAAGVALALSTGAGTGGDVTPDVSDECENCNGTGEIGDGRIVKPCPICGGTGKKKSKDNIQPMSFAPITAEVAEELAAKVETKLSPKFEAISGDLEKLLQPAPVQERVMPIEVEKIVERLVEVPAKKPIRRIEFFTPKKDALPDGRPRIVCEFCEIQKRQDNPQHEADGWVIESIDSLPNMRTPTNRIWFGDLYIDHVGRLEPARLREYLAKLEASQPKK